MVPNKDTKSIRLLGVYLDSNLNLSEHCKHIHRKISRSLYSLNLVKNILNKDCMKLVFNAHVQSHLEYCCNILGMAPEKYLKPLKIVQKKAIRIISGASYNEHTPPLFKENKILPLAELINYNIFKFMLGCLAHGLKTDNVELMLCAIQMISTSPMFDAFHFLNTLCLIFLVFKTSYLMILKILKLIEF